MTNDPLIDFTYILAGPEKEREFYPEPWDKLLKEFKKGSENDILTNVLRKFPSCFYMNLSSWHEYLSSGRAEARVKDFTISKFYDDIFNMLTGHFKVPKNILNSKPLPRQDRFKVTESFQNIYVSMDSHFDPYYTDTLEYRDMMTYQRVRLWSHEPVSLDWFMRGPHYDTDLGFGPDFEESFWFTWKQIVSSLLIYCEVHDFSVATCKKVNLPFSHYLEVLLNPSKSLDLIFGSLDKAAQASASPVTSPVPTPKEAVPTSNTSQRSRTLTQDEVQAFFKVAIERGVMDTWSFTDSYDPDTFSVELTGSKLILCCDKQPSQVQVMEDNATKQQKALQTLKSQIPSSEGTLYPEDVELLSKLWKTQ